jgi:Skp family chaperone for outer membrane proteins
MEAKFGAERDRLEKQNRDLQRLADTLKNPGSNPNREALEKTRQDFLRKRQDFEQKARDFSAKSEKEEAQLRNEMMDLVFGTAKEFAVKKGFTYLVDANAGIFYADPSFDVTKEFVDEVNRRWKENPSASGGGKK